MKGRFVLRFKIYTLLFFLTFLIFSSPSFSEEDNFTKGLGYYYSGDLTKALEAFETVLKGSPPNPEALFYKAQILSYKGQTLQAIEVIKKAVNAEPDNLFYTYKLAEFYGLVKDDASAISIWQDIKSKLPGETKSYYELADIYEKQGKLSLAISELEEVLNVETQASVKVFYRLGKLCLKIGNEAKGIYYINKSLEFEPENLDILLFLGNFYYENGNYSNALNYYKGVINTDPYRIQIHRRIAYIYYMRKDYKNSAVHLEKICRLEKDRIKNHYNLGCIYCQTANYEGAIKEFSRVLEKTPEDGSSHYNLGCIYFKTGNYDNALKKFSRAVELSPHDSRYLYALGAIHYLRKEPEKAYEIFKLIDYKNTSFYIKRGVTYRNKGMADIPFLEIDFLKEEL